MQPPTLLVDTVAECRETIDFNSIPSSKWVHRNFAHLKAKSERVISSLSVKYNVSSINLIKPGIAEATRAVLRRVPEHVLVRSLQDPDVALLVYLAREKNITITEVGDRIGQFRAVTIIKKVQ